METYRLLKDFVFYIRMSLPPPTAYSFAISELAYAIAHLVQGGIPVEEALQRCGVRNVERIVDVVRKLSEQHQVKQPFQQPWMYNVVFGGEDYNSPRNLDRWLSYVAVS